MERPILSSRMASNRVKRVKGVNFIKTFKEAQFFGKNKKPGNCLMAS